MNNKQTMPSYLVELEHELADAHDRIRLLIAERDTARLQADQKINLREDFRELLGTDDIEQGVAVVREIKQRIKRLEEFANRFLNHDDLGWAIGKHDRDEAREALGKERVESK